MEEAAALAQLAAGTAYAEAALLRQWVLAGMQQFRLTERVRLTIHDATEASLEEQLAAWQGVTDGWTDAEIAQIEALAVTRSHFMQREP